jgi:hypothetical protein
MRKSEVDACHINKPSKENRISVEKSERISLITRSLILVFRESQAAGRRIAYAAAKAIKNGKSTGKTKRIPTINRTVPSAQAKRTLAKYSIFSRFILHL